MSIAIIGAGIGGLTLALALHRHGLKCEIFEAAPEMNALGLGINLLPHATGVLDRLGLTAALTHAAVTTKESLFYNRFGQLIHRESCGRYGDFAHPQFSIHRGDLQTVLLAALKRVGRDVLHLAHRLRNFEQSDGLVKLHFEDTATGKIRDVRSAKLVIGADGLHSRLRKILHPNEGEPVYSGVNMWRGACVMEPFLTGASMVRLGWIKTGKFVAYPIRDNVDGEGRQLVNWVVELEVPARPAVPDWNKTGRLRDFLPVFDGWNFGWIHVPDMIRKTDRVLEFPWSIGTR